jgi:hypothetical protein
VLTRNPKILGRSFNPFYTRAVLAGDYGNARRNVEGVGITREELEAAEAGLLADARGVPKGKVWLNK